MRLLFYHYDNCSLDNTVKFLDFLRANKNQFKVTNNDLDLIINSLGCYLDPGTIKEKMDLLNYFLKSDESRDNGYYESRLKYCNFYIDYSGDKCDKKKLWNCLIV